MVCICLMWFDCFYGSLSNNAFRTFSNLQWDVGKGSEYASGQVLLPVSVSVSLCLCLCLSLSLSLCLSYFLIGNKKNPLPAWESYSPMNLFVRNRTVNAKIKKGKINFKIYIVSLRINSSLRIWTIKCSQSIFFPPYYDFSGFDTNITENLQQHNSF